MRATRRGWTIRRACLKLITDSIYHDFKLSLMVVFFAGPNIVLAYDCRHQSNSINLVLFSHAITLLFRRFTSQNEYMKKEPSCHIGTYILCKQIRSQTGFELIL